MIFFENKAFFQTEQISFSILMQNVSAKFVFPYMLCSNLL